MNDADAYFARAGKAIKDTLGVGKIPEGWRQTDPGWWEHPSGAKIFSSTLDGSYFLRLPEKKSADICDDLAAAFQAWEDSQE